MNTIWVEKYRPTNLNDVTGNIDIIDRLKNIMDNSCDIPFPNLILCGSSGLGKTSSMYAMAKTMLKGQYRKASLSIDTYEAGIDTVRNNIKVFCQQKADLPLGVYKLILIDEADSMTTAAQQALRTIMEDYSNNVRFIFTINTLSGIIDSLQSRCVIYYYHGLTYDDISERLKYISQKENIRCDDSAYELIALSSQGDLRTAINYLESVAALHSNITVDDVSKLCDIPPLIQLETVLDHCRNGQLDDATSLLGNLFDLGYCAMDIYITITCAFKIIDFGSNLEQKHYFMKCISERALNIQTCKDSKLQIYGLIALLCKMKIILPCRITS